MKTTAEFLSAIARQNDDASDYRLAQILGVTKQTISNYQSGKGYLGAETCIKVAELLNLAPGYVLTCVAAERASDKSIRNAWETAAKALAGTAAALVLATVFFPRYEDLALAFSLLAMPLNSNVYYVKYAIEIATYPLAAQILLSLALLTYAHARRRCR